MLQIVCKNYIFAEKGVLYGTGYSFRTYRQQGQGKFRQVLQQCRAVHVCRHIYVREKRHQRTSRIPFEVREPSVRYNANDIEALKKGIEQLNAGKGVEHELIEVDD